MPNIAIGLGSNMGERLRNIEEAVRQLVAVFGEVALSPLYETAPMYVTDQPAFLNAAALASTEMGPIQVLKALKEIESAVGRLPRERYGPREIDLDLLLYGTAQVTIRDGDRTVLQVPHPRTPERRFVLQPLGDLLPDGELPGLGLISTLLEATNAQADTVVRVDHAALSLHRN